jgi:hypothetical protein
MARLHDVTVPSFTAAAAHFIVSSGKVLGHMLVRLASNQIIYLVI